MHRALSTTAHSGKPFQPRCVRGRNRIAKATQHALGIIIQMIGPVSLEGDPLPLSVLIPLCCLVGSPCAETTSGSSFTASFRDLVAIFLPPSLFLLVGQPIADWPLASPQSTREAFSLSLTLSLGAILFVRSMGPGLRLQPLLAALTVLAGLLLPTGVALERFFQVSARRALDDGHLGIVAVAAASFALGTRLIGQPSSFYAGSPPPHRSARPHGALMLAWVVAALANSTAPGDAAATLFVAAGTALFASASASIAFTGVASPRHVLTSMLAGLLAAAPAATHLTPQFGALAGLFGALMGQLSDRVLRGAADDATLLLPAHLGGALAGLVVDAFFRQGTGQSLGSAFASCGIAFTLCAVAILLGAAVRGAIGSIGHRHGAEEVREIGIDLVEHGCKTRDDLGEAPGGFRR